VTHDATIARRADRIVRMLDGRIDTTTPTTTGATNRAAPVVLATT
jgi:ABC-type lipoprotein export system ATPase subunit